MCKPWMMLHVVVQRLFLDAYKPWKMCENLGWYSLPLAHFIWLMHVWHDWCCLVDAHMPRLMCASLGWCIFSLVDVSLQMHIVNDRFLLVDSLTPQMMCVVLGSCFLSLADVSWPIYASHNLCRQDDTLRPWVMSPSWCAHFTVDVSMTFMILHTVSRGYLLDVHMPCPCMQALDDIASH